MAYSASGLASKKPPPITEAGSGPNTIPKLSRNGTKFCRCRESQSAGGNPFLDPAAYRAPMIFQLAEEYYKVPNLYNNLLERVIIPGQNSGAAFGREFDFQIVYEHMPVRRQRPLRITGI